MDLSPIVNALVPIAAAVVTTCVPVAVGYLIHKVGLDKDSALRDSLNTALTNGIGQAVLYGQKQGDAALSNVQIKNGALAAMVAYAAANAPDAIKHFGLTPDDVAQKAAGLLAQHLAYTAAPASPPVVPEAKA